MKKFLLIALTVLTFSAAADAQVLGKGDLFKQKKVKKIEKVLPSQKNKMEVKGMRQASKVKNQGMWINKMTAVEKNSAVTSAMSSTKSLVPHASSDQVWFKYPMGSSLGLYGNDSLAKWGGVYYDWLDKYFKGQNVYNVSVLVDATYAGATIDSLSAIFYNPAKIKKVIMWASNRSVEGGYYTAPPTDPTKADVYVEVPVEDIKGVQNGLASYTDIKLPQTLKVGEYGTYVGYYIDGQSGDMPIIFSSKVDNGGHYAMGNVNAGAPEWCNLAGFFGNLTIAAHMNIAGLPDNNLEVGYFDEAVTTPGVETDLATTVYNATPYPVTSLSYYITEEGVAQNEQTMKVDSLQSGLGVIYFPYTPKEYGEKSVTVTVTKVNGKENLNKYKESLVGYVVVPKKAMDRTSLVEEITGTWCGFCPRGIVGLNNLKRDLGGKVITVAAHFPSVIGAADAASDPMYCAEYDSLAIMLDESYPNSLVDRVIDMDPYAGLYQNIDQTVPTYKYGATEVVNLVSKVVPSEASFSLKADWEDKTTQNKIVVDVATSFGLTRMAANYAIGFVLLEDGMTGTTEEWKQANYYAQEFIDWYKQTYGKTYGSIYYSDTDMQEFRNGPALMDLTYDHVAVGAWNPTWGYDGSVDGLIIEDEVYPFKKTLDISANKLIQDKSKLSVVAILINRNTHAVVNAAECLIGGTSGIECIKPATADSKVAYSVSVNGSRLQAPVKGINIQKMTDGTVRKVVVK